MTYGALNNRPLATNSYVSSLPYINIDKKLVLPSQTVINLMGPTRRVVNLIGLQVHAYCLVPMGVTFVFCKLNFKKIKIK